MRSFNFKKLLPHLIAIVVFLVVTLIFCKPALESDVILKQGDVTGWQGMSHQSFEYLDQHGHFPLWVTNMFSGMPGYQVAMGGDWSPIILIDKIIQLGLPQPMNFFFLACIGFYFLCICLKIKPWAAILGSIGFAYCSFSPIIVTAGHNTQMLALAYAPAVLGSAILLLDKKYWSGFATMTLLTALQINQGHQQISYYLFLVLGFMMVAYAIRLIRNGETLHLAKSLGLMLIAGIIGIGVSAISLLPVYDFSKDSKRGGQLVIDKKDNPHDNVVDGKTTGLSKDYAFMWSYGIGETWSLLFPAAKGYGTHVAERDGDQYVFPKLDENSHVAGFLAEKLNVPEDQAANYALQQSGAIYWGDQPYTNGPIYLGALMCFLFVIGMFILDGKHKWWILVATVFGILLSWGNNFPGLNYFLFDHFPLYNKFRVPTMALVIPQLLVPVIAALTVDKLWDHSDPDILKKFRKGLIATGVLFLLAGAYYTTSDFSKENIERTTRYKQLYNANDPEINSKLAALGEKFRPSIDNQLFEGMLTNLKDNPDAQKTAREFVSSIRKDRADFFMSDMLRSFIIVLIGAALIFFYLKRKLSPAIMVGGLALITVIDLLGFGINYLNDKSFANKDQYEETEFPKSEADLTILNDKDPNFRVYNTRSLEESKTSYYHKSIGGYHPAKLGIYDDLMAYQLSGSPNISVINMLNAKYVLQQQGNKVVAIQNPGALGNAWFVKAVRFVHGPVEEMLALNQFDPKDTAIADDKYSSLAKGFVPPDSTSSIRMTTFDNDAITYQSSSPTTNLAVFSEVYYKDWKAYIDGKPADYFKVNYVLRAMVVPAGNHKIEFKFEPAIFFAGKRISFISSWLVVLILAGFVFYQWKSKKEISQS